jgi:D-sedoheptulose 7-phosphate isomerase
MHVVRQYLDDTARVITSLSADDIAPVLDLLMTAWRARRHVFLLGNGGSAATASHFANDLSKGTFIEGKPRFRAIALTDNVPLITAWGNDCAYECVFSEQLAALMDPGDLVLAISASGNSPNVLRAVEDARLKGAITIGWTGRSGGKLRSLVHHCICAPSDDVGQIENVHMVLDHVLTVALRAAIVEQDVAVPVRHEGWAQ